MGLSYNIENCTEVCVMEFFICHFLEEELTESSLNDRILGVNGLDQINAIEVLS